MPLFDVASATGLDSASIAQILRLLVPQSTAIQWASGASLVMPYPVTTTPPSTTIICPVIILEDFEDMKRTVSTMS